MKCNVSSKSLKHLLSEYAKNGSRCRADLILLIGQGSNQLPSLRTVDKMTNGLITRRVDQAQWQAGLNQSLVIETNLETPGLNRIILVGLGIRSELTSEVVRDVLTTAFVAARQAGSQNLILPESPGLLKCLPNPRLPTFAELVFEHALLVDYEINHQKTLVPEPRSHFQELTLLLEKPVSKEVEQAVISGRRIALATNAARNWTNLPSNIMTPQALADLAIAMQEQYKGALETTVYNEDSMSHLGMNGILSVGRASEYPPRLITVSYTPERRHQGPVLALVAKGVTLDTGGLSLKEQEDMVSMKSDMAAAAAVLAVMQLLPWLKPKVKVVAVIAAAENLIGSRAYRPGDIVTTYSEKTVEIKNTDCEGRMLLADALTFAQQDCGADEIFDLATLTYNVQAALGDMITGLLGNDPQFMQTVMRAALQAGEPVWQLPLYAPYRMKNLTSKMADLSNFGGAPGAIVSASFLSEFIQPGVSWVHADIGGTAFLDTENGVNPEDATGVMVRTMVKLLKSYPH